MLSFLKKETNHEDYFFKNRDTSASIADLEIEDSQMRCSEAKLRFWGLGSTPNKRKRATGETKHFVKMRCVRTVALLAEMYAVNTHTLLAKKHEVDTHALLAGFWQAGIKLF